MDIPPAIIYAVVTTLVSAIVFMAGGFIYVLKEVKTKWFKAEELLNDYREAYCRLEERYKALEVDYQELLNEHKVLLETSKRRDD